MKILIVDDEKLARQRLRGLLEQLDDDHSIIAEASNGREALESWHQNQADLLLLDIRMPGIDGLQVAGELARQKSPPAIIFTTAYDDYALQAFEKNAVDYLLKPIRKDRLQSALAKAVVFSRGQWQGIQQELDNEITRSHICVHALGNLHLVPIPDIYYFLADQKYVTIKTAACEYLIEDPLKQLEQEFADQFLRIHRNALVSLRHIAELHKDIEGQLTIAFKGMVETLVVSRRHAANVRNRFKMFDRKKD